MSGIVDMFMSLDTRFDGLNIVVVVVVVVVVVSYLLYLYIFCSNKICLVPIACCHLQMFSMI